METEQISLLPVVLGIHTEYGYQYVKTVNHPTGSHSSFYLKGVSVPDYPPELENVERLSKIAADLNFIGEVSGVSDDISIIARAAIEIVQTSRGLVEAAETDFDRAKAFIGMPMLGSYMSGYKRALKDMGIGERTA